MSPWALLGLLLVWAGSLAWATNWGIDTGKARCEAAGAREEALVAKVADAAASGAAAAIVKVNVRHQTVIQEVQHDVVEKPVYRDCRSGDDAVRLFNSTIPGAAASAVLPGGRALPASDPTGE